jgi:hypothetical protein
VETGKPGSSKVDPKRIGEVEPKERLKNWGNILDNYRSN